MNTYTFKILAVLITAVALLACERNAGNSTVTASPTGVTKLVILDTQRGNGAMADFGRQITVHYTGWLYDGKAELFHGKQFDSSRGDENNQSRPFSFTLGAAQVIPGWDQGIVGMKIGGRRTLIVPGALAYGERGTGHGLIPKNATLIFDIELLSVKPMN